MDPRRPLSSHDQISPTFPDISVNKYVVSSLATVVKTKCMLFLTAIFFHNYDNYFLYAKYYLVNNSFVAYFESRTIRAVVDRVQKHIFADFSPTTLKLPDFTRFSS